MNLSAATSCATSRMIRVVECVVMRSCSPRANLIIIRALNWSKKKISSVNQLFYPRQLKTHPPGSLFSFFLYIFLNFFFIPGYFFLGVKYRTAAVNDTTSSAGPQILSNTAALVCRTYSDDRPRVKFFSQADGLTTSNIYL